MRRHRSPAISRDPGRGQTAVLAWVQPQRALALFLKDEAVLNDAALAPRPGCRVFVVDARADRVDRAQIVAAHGFDPEQHFAAVRVEAVPDVAETARCFAVGNGWAGRAGRRRSS